MAYWEEHRRKLDEIINWKDQTSQIDEVSIKVKLENYYKELLVDTNFSGWEKSEYLACERYKYLADVAYYLEDLYQDAPDRGIWVKRAIASKIPQSLFNQYGYAFRREFLYQDINVEQRKFILEELSKEILNSDNEEIISALKEYNPSIYTKDFINSQATKLQIRLLKKYQQWYELLYNDDDNAQQKLLEIEEELEQRQLWRKEDIINPYVLCFQSPPTDIMLNKVYEKGLMKAGVILAEGYLKNILSSQIINVFVNDIKKALYLIHEVLQSNDELAKKGVAKLFQKLPNIKTAYDLDVKPLELFEKYYEYEYDSSKSNERMMVREKIWKLLNTDTNSDDSSQNSVLRARAVIEAFADIDPYVRFYNSKHKEYEKKMRSDSSSFPFLERSLIFYFKLEPRDKLICEDANFAFEQGLIKAGVELAFDCIHYGIKLDLKDISIKILNSNDHLAKIGFHTLITDVFSDETKKEQQRRISDLFVAEPKVEEFFEKFNALSKTILSPDSEIREADKQQVEVPRRFSSIGL